MAIERKLPVCIHAGMPKTGTTTLQHGVFDQIPALASIGKLIPRTTAGKAWRGCLRRLCSDPSWEEAEQENAAAALDDLMAEKPADYWTGRSSIVLSFESLFNTKGAVGPIERADRLVGVLRSAGFHGDLHYWLTTREPIAFMESQYLNFVQTLKRIPTLEEWVEGRYERWDLFDYLAIQRGLRSLDGLASVTFVPMSGLFQREPAVIEAVSDALSLDEESRERFLRSLSEAPRLKERPDELRFLFGRLHFELSQRGIPLGWAVSLLEFATSGIDSLRSSDSPPGGKMKTLSTIRTDLSGYRKDGLRGSGESPPRT
jgi:hypothetical protein